MGLFKWPPLCASSLPRSLRAHGGPFSLSVSARARVALSWGTGVGTSAGSAGPKFPDLQHQRVQYGRAFSIHIFFSSSWHIVVSGTIFGVCDIGIC